MSAAWPPELLEGTDGLSAAALLVLLVVIVLAASARRRAAGGIRVASPAFVPLAAEAASEVADALGALVGELLAGTQPGREH